MFCATSSLEGCSLPHRDVPAPGTQLHLLPSEAQVGEFAAGFVGAVGALCCQVLGGDFSTQSFQLRLVTDLSRNKDKDLVTSMAVPGHSCPHNRDSLQQQILLWGFWSALAIPVNIPEAGIPPCLAAGECEDVSFLQIHVGIQGLSHQSLPEGGQEVQGQRNISSDGNAQELPKEMEELLLGVVGAAHKGHNMGFTNSHSQLSQHVGPWFHGSETSLCTSDQMCPTPVQTQHSKRENILIFGIGISHLVLIDSRAGAQQEQGEGGALELFTHLPKEVTERPTWERERGNNENIALTVPWSHVPTPCSLSIVPTPWCHGTLSLLPGALSLLFPLPVPCPHALSSVAGARSYSLSLSPLPGALSLSPVHSPVSLSLSHPHSLVPCTSSPVKRMLKAYVGSPPLASLTQSWDEGTQPSCRAAWQK
ncbi:hypothetical protein Nmel_015373 [Mimus melanotis]